MKVMLRFLAAAAALCATPVFAGGKYHIEPHPLPDTTVIRGVRVIDGTGKPALENAVVVIHKKWIVEIRSAEGYTPPRKHTEVLDWPGRTVIPGLINAHGHLGLLKDRAENDVNAYTEANVVADLYTYQRYGVTTMVSLGLNRDLIFDLRKRQHQGEIGGATILTAGRGIGVEDGAPPVAVADDQVYRPRSASEAREDVKGLAKQHVDLIKIWVDDLHGSRPKMQPEIYTAVIDEAHKHHIRVASHVYTLADAKLLVAAGVDILGHSVRDQAVDDELVAALKAKGVWYIPTLTVDESGFIYAGHPAWMLGDFYRLAAGPVLSEKLESPAYREKILADPATEQKRADFAMASQNLKRLYDSGVKIGFGTDSGAMPGRIPGFSEHRELELLVAAGLTPLQALQLATSNNAEMLHLPETGVLAKGKLADLIVLDGDPTADIRNTQKIVAVWHNGHRLGDIETK